MLIRVQGLGSKIGMLLKHGNKWETHEENIGETSAEGLPTPSKADGTTGKSKMEAKPKQICKQAKLGEQD